MPHTVKQKKMLLNRVRTIMGQVAAIERSFDRETADCLEIPHNISSCRGDIDALMAQAIEGPHSESHPPEGPRSH